MSGCRLCPPALSREQGWELWRKDAEQGARYASLMLKSKVSPEEVTRHMHSHRVEQPPYTKRPKAACLKAMSKISDRERSVVSFVARFPATDLETIALLFYDSGKKRASLKSASRAVRKLMEQDMLYRLYLRSLPGPGPRPRPDPSPLFFLGGVARPWIAELTGNLPGRGEWCSGRDDWQDWREPWEMWKRSESLRFLLQAMPETAPRQRSLGPITLTDRDIWSGKAIPGVTEDQLLGRFRWRPDAVAFVGFEGRQTPLLLCSDNPAKSGKQVARDIVKAAGVGRSGCLQKLVPSSEPPLALLWTRDAGRAAEVLPAARRMISGRQVAIAADFSTASVRPEGQIWLDLKAGDHISLHEALQRNSL